MSDCFINIKPDDIKQYRNVGNIKYIFVCYGLSPVHMANQMRQIEQKSLGLGGTNSGGHADTLIRNCAELYRELTQMQIQITKAG